MHSSGSDSTGGFVLALAAGPFLLPMIGVEVTDLLFAVPLVLCAYAAVLGFRALRGRGPRRAAWGAIGVTGLLGACSSALGLAAEVAGHGASLAFYTGIAASLAMTVAAALLARSGLREAGAIAIVDPALVAGVAVAVAFFLIALPGYADGDVVLTTVFVIDLAGLLLASIGLVGSMPRGAKIAVISAFLLVCTGDGLVALSAAGLSDAPAWATALLWSATAWAMALAVSRDHRVVRPAEPEISRRWVVAHVALPLAAVLAYPAACAAIVLEQGFAWETLTYFGVLFGASVIVAFARQGTLLVANSRAMASERTLRAEAQRRNSELEALTGLATTMTEVLEEGAMVERGLEALRVAARTSSSALHLFADDDKLRLTAATGAWQVESVWAAPPAELDGVISEHRGRRHIARLPLVARGRTLGLVTLVRPDRDVAFEAELELLSLLVDQLAIALQNARDYREKLDLAIRDPLTGLYNRRFFYEAFQKEVDRHERYGSSAALVLFDVDDFKSINDTLGHQAGDEVLQRISEIVTDLIRPADSFARVGGEEFGLLLPETTQFDALLAAERLRTAIARHEILPGRKVTISGGVASMPQDGADREDLERKADGALYWAKRNGKNMCAVASEVIEEDVAEGVDVMMAHLHAVVAGIDGQHLHTRDHSENVAAYAVAIGQALGLTSERIVKIRRAALLHDVGKIAVPDVVLEKPAKLSAEEYAQIQIHPEVGGHMLAHAGLRDEARWVRHHHERLDGRGYPDRIEGDAIELEARIIFVADSFEAMTSDRPYRRGLPVSDAVAELEACAGSQFDPVVVRALVELVMDGRLAVLALRDAA